MIPNNYIIRRISWWLEQSRFLFFKRKLTQEDINFLEKYFSYYSRLNEKHKKEFLVKLEMILSSKKFQARGGLDIITSEMEVLISATMTMVTFGWKRLCLAHFHTILVYPNAYFSTSNKTYHRGEVNPRFGLIVVSWRCFVEGFLNENDGINLGIHEIAHALKLANQIESDGEKEFDRQAWIDYRSQVPFEIQEIQSGQNSFFRQSAGLNEHEFFAVALESFFERPWEFFRAKQELYQLFVRLLRQDPRVLAKVEEGKIHC
jgi:Mlc titration factor MtfA (ptsG expression regulator)